MGPSSHFTRMWTRCGHCKLFETDCILSRAPRTKETMPDFYEWCRVTQHPRIFRWLTGCQRDTPVLGCHTSRRLTHDCFGKKMIQQFASEGSSIYLLKLGMRFSRTKIFCFENDVFLTFGLGMSEGVSEDLRSGKG